MTEQGREALLIHRQQIVARQLKQLGTRLKLRQRSDRISHTVVWASYLARVTAIDPPAEPDTGGQRPAVLNREARQTAARVERGVRRIAVERLSGAIYHTAAASGTRKAARSVGRHVDGREYRADKEVGSRSRKYKLTVQPDKTESGPDGPVSLTQRSRIDAYPRQPSPSLTQTFGSPFEPSTQHLVIVVAERIGRKTEFSLSGQHRGGIRESGDNHGARTFKQQRGIAAHVGIAVEIVHRIVASGRDPLVVGCCRPSVDRLYSRYAETICARLRHKPFEVGMSGHITSGGHRTHILRFSATLWQAEEPLSYCARP